MDLAKDAEISVNISDYKNKTDKRLPRSKNSNRATCYTTPNAKQAFTQLRQAFTKALIFRHSNLKRYVWIGTNALGYAIDEVLSQLIQISWANGTW